MTLGAGLGQVQFEDWGIAVLDRNNSVRAVAIRAGGRRRGSHRLAHAVDAGGVFLDGRLMVGLCFVARGTLRFGQFALVDQLLDAGVAIDAGQFAMDGGEEGVRRKDRHGDGFPLHLPAVGGITVAVKAIRIGKAFGTKQAGWQKGQAEQER